MKNDFGGLDSRVDNNAIRHGPNSFGPFAQFETAAIKQQFADLETKFNSILYTIFQVAFKSGP